MNTLRNASVLGLIFLLTSPLYATSLPTLHAVGQHHYAVLLVPPSVHPVVVKITDDQQKTFLHLTLDAEEGIEENIDFSWVPAGYYYVEVHHEDRVFYKTVYVRPDRVSSLDATVSFQRAPNAQL